MPRADEFDPDVFEPYLETPPRSDVSRAAERWARLIEKVFDAGGNWLVIRDAGTADAMRTSAAHLRKAYGDEVEFMVREVIVPEKRHSQMKLFARARPAVVLSIPQTPPGLPSPAA